MQRALHLAIGAGISPFHQWTTPRSFHSSFPKLALLSKSRVYCCSSRESYRPSLRFLTSGSGSNGRCIASRMSAKGQDQSRADADAATSPSVVIPPIAHTSNISFCQSCGGPTKQVIPDGDEKLRAVCTVCSKIYYANPKMVVGCLVEHCNKVLLCKRNIEPSYGFWTLPAGYLEIGESAAEGAIRETLEEASAEVDVLSPFAQLDIPRIGQSYIIFRAKLKKPQFSPGPESLECALFGLDEIPFDTIAFSSIFVTLKLYIEDIKAGSFKFHYCTINKRPGASPSDPNGFSVDYQLHC